MRPFTTKISFCAGLSINSRNNAVFYPAIDKFVQAFSKKEEIHQNMKKITGDYERKLQHEKQNWMRDSEEGP